MEEKVNRLKKTIIMNISEAKRIPLEDFLRDLGYEPDRRGHNRTLWYKSPIRPNETDASFKVDKSKNVWYDHGLGIGGSIIDLGMRLYNESEVSAVLRRIAERAPAIPSKICQVIASDSSTRSIFRDVEFMPLEDDRLVSYIMSRKIDYKIAMAECQEVHYTCYRRPFKGIAFRNRKGGSEIRSVNFKGCISPKDITYKKADEQHDADICCVFEGFMDYLSFLTLCKSIEWIGGDGNTRDFVILNSVSLWHNAISVLEQYDRIDLYLDNDPAGHRTVDSIIEALPGKVVKYVLPERCPKYKDLNDFLMGKRMDTD